MSEFYQTVQRLIRDKVTPVCGSGGTVWDVCERLVPELPQKFLERLAVEALVDAYFRAVDSEKRETTATAPSGSKRPRSLVALPSTDDEVNQRMWASIDEASRELKAALRREWTDELLAATFTLQDGSTATWGAATAIQHQEAADAELESALRHRAAVEMLGESGEDCLLSCLGAAA